MNSQVWFVGGENGWVGVKIDGGFFCRKSAAVSEEWGL